MPRTGTFGGFDFDPEVFSDYLSEQPYWNNAVIASGAVREDSTIMSLIGEKGNVATIPFYTPLDATVDAALNNDGETDNAPTTISGAKQTCMLIQRMKAWKEKDFTRELTGAKPLDHVAASVANYYQQVWQNELMTIAKAVMSVSALASHVFDVTAVGDGKADATSLIYAEQAALGDSSNDYGLIVMHSMVYANYKALQLVDYQKYTLENALRTEVTLPTINGKPVLVDDRASTIDASEGTTYMTWLFGEGAFLSANKTNYADPNYTDYDPETNGGERMLYTKQGRVLHPNGLSYDVTAPAKESPTNAELGATANWTLKYNARNVRIGVMKSKG